MSSKQLFVAAWVLGVLGFLSLMIPVCLVWYDALVGLPEETQPAWEAVGVTHFIVAVGLTFATAVVSDEARSRARKGGR